MEASLVANYLNCSKHVVFVVIAFEHLPKAAFPQDPQDLKPVRHMVSFFHLVIPSLIIITCNFHDNALKMTTWFQKDRDDK